MGNLWYRYMQQDAWIYINIHILCVQYKLSNSQNICGYSLEIRAKEKWTKILFVLPGLPYSLCSKGWDTARMHSHSLWKPHKV
jgi:hypothetical protein